MTLPAPSPRHFTKEIDDLKAQLVAMGRLVEDRIHLAMRALLDRDVSLTGPVIDGDEDIDRLQVEIDERCFKLLALYQPMAVDLRSIVAAVKINCDLERVADLAVNIAEATRRYLHHPPVKMPPEVRRTSSFAQGMLHDALEAFASGNVAVAQNVLDRDDALDEMDVDVCRELVALMIEDPRTIEPAMNLILVSRHLERIGDHATNIAEAVIYVVEARDVREAAATAVTQ